MHAGQIVLEEEAVYAVTSTEVAGVVEEATAGIVGGFAADVDAEDMDVGAHGEAVELVPEFCFGHDALVPVGAQHFSREDVLIDGDVDREVERVEKVWKLARDATIQDVILCEAADADRCGCAQGLILGYETLQLTFDDVGLGTFRANDEDGAAVAVSEENVADPGAAAHEAREDGFSEIDVMVINDECEVFADFFAPEAREVMEVAVVKEMDATCREVRDATADLIRGGIVAEASGTGQRGEIEDARSERRRRRARDRGRHAPR